jgi:hypothetical protein
MDDRQGERLAKGLSEGEIRQKLSEGGRLRNVFVVCKPGGPLEHLAFIRPSWRRDFLPLRTWGDKANRYYRDVDRLLQLIREDFGYQGVIPFYVSDDPELPRYRVLVAALGSAEGSTQLEIVDGLPPASEADLKE